MGAGPSSSLRLLWKTLSEGLMWTGFAWSGMCPPCAWKESAALPADRPCLPPLSDAEIAQWTALVRQLG
jgi:hypothetical protein